MERYTNNVQDGFGNAISGVTVTIRRVSDGGLASIFSDNSSTPKSNPFTNDSDSEFFFYAADNRYNVLFTGPITDQIDDVLLSDLAEVVGNFDILTNIATATPPTTEAVTGQFRILDRDADDLLGFMGYNGNNVLRLTNIMRGGGIRLEAEDDSGTLRNILISDPDAGVTLTYQGVQRLLTDGAGAIIYGTLSNDPGAGGVQDALIRLRSQQGSSAGWVGFLNTVDLYYRNTVHGGQVIIQAEDSGGSLRTFLTGDPDASTILRGDTDLQLQVAAGETAIFCSGNGGVGLRYNNIERFSTSAGGLVLLRSDGNTDAENRLFDFMHQDGTIRGRIGYAGNGVFALANQIHGESVLITAEDAGGSVRTILDADPDAITELRGDTELHLTVGIGGETALLATANSDTVIFYNNVAEFRTVNHQAALKISGAEIQDQLGVWRPVGFGVSPQYPLAGTGTVTYFSRTRAQGTIYWTGGSATNIDTYASTGSSQTDIPNETFWVLQNNGAGTLTFRGGSGVTIRHWDGLGSAPPDEDVVIPRGAQALIRKVSNTVYDISHNGG